MQVAGDRVERRSVTCHQKGIRLRRSGVGVGRTERAPTEVPERELKTCYL